MKLTKKTLEKLPVEHLKDGVQYKALTNQAETLYGAKNFTETVTFTRDLNKADDSLITVEDIEEAQDDVSVGWNENVTLTPEMVTERILRLPHPIADGANGSVRIATEGSGWLELFKDFEILDKSSIKWHKHVALMAGDIVTVDHRARFGDVVK